MNRPNHSKSYDVTLMMNIVLPVLISLFSPCILVSAWSPTRIITQHSYHYCSNLNHPNSFVRALSSTLSSTLPDQILLSSAYDRNLPAALVGEAVRSAMRSDRGICFDFTTDRYFDGKTSSSSSSEINSSRLVSVVKMNGEGTVPFINAKFSWSVPTETDKSGGDIGLQLSAHTQLVRRGNSFETAYLTPKGRIIDRLFVLQFPTNDDDEDLGDAFLVTSPGNSGIKLYNELSPLVFPMDKVTLIDETSSSQTHVLTLACSSLNDAQNSFNNNILKLLMNDESYDKKFEFPSDGICHHYRVSAKDTTTNVYIMHHTFLSTEICHGYTLLLQESTDSNNDTPSLAEQIWENLTDEQNDSGPVGVGSLEWDTLRVEAGLPAYGNEMVGDGPKKKDQDDKGEDGTYYAKASPLELHLYDLVDTEKGCYQGQEGVASMLKNKRGCPRTLYQAVFHDLENDFDDDGSIGGFGLLNSIDNNELLEFQKLKKDADPISNDTRQPRAGDNIYVLGSNESIQVGKITSCAQPNGTGDTKTISLALVKRPGSILKAIKELDLELPRWWEDVENSSDDENEGNNEGLDGIANEKDGSGMIQPPPLDPLHNLEVVIEGSYTIGRLVSIPSRRYKKKSEVASLLDFEQRGEVVDSGGPAYLAYNSSKESQIVGEGEEDSDSNQIVDEMLVKAEEEAAKAKAEAEAAAAEAKRKEEKMRLLQEKAAAAMAARRRKKRESS